MVLGAVGAGIAGGAGINIVINAIDNFSRTFASAQVQMTGLTGSILRNQKAILGAGAALTGIGVLGAVAIGSMVSEAISFETAFTGVRKTVELTEAEFEQLENRFKTMSTEIPVTFQELSAIGEIAGQLGVTGVDNLEKFTRTIADISATTNLTAEGAATDFARLANVMQEPLDNIDRMGSVVVELGNNFATTESEILGFATRIAGVSKIVGLTTADTLAIGAAFTAVGVQQEAGGTAFQKVMLEMNESVIMGGEKLEVFAKTAGVTGEEFQKIFKEDASRAFELFVLGLGKQGDSAIATLDELGLAEVRTTRSLLSLANAEDLISKTLKTSDKEWKKNTALTIEAEKRYKTMAAQIKKLTNKFTILSADLGDDLFPILEDIIDVIGDMVSWFSNLSDGTKKMIIYTGLAVTAFALIAGPLLIVVALLPSLIGGLVLLGNAFFGAAASATTAQAAFLGLQVAMRGVAGLGLVAISIGFAISAMNEEDTAKALGKIFVSSLAAGIAALMFGVGAPVAIAIGVVTALVMLDMRFGFVEKTQDFISDTMDTIKSRWDAVSTGALNFKDIFKGHEEGREDVIYDMERGVAMTRKEWENYKKQLDTDLPIMNQSIEKHGELIGSPTKGSYPIVYSLIQASKEWNTMGSVAVINILRIIQNLNAIPRNITTTHTIRTVYTGGSSRMLSFAEGGVMPYTGLAMLHQGETITPASESSGGKEGITINIENINGLDPDAVAEALQEKLDTLIST